MNEQQEIMKTMDEDAATQVRRQYDEIKVTGLKRDPDLAQFRSDLDAMSDERYGQIQKLVEQATIVDIRELYKLNKLSAVELVTYYLKRIKKHDVNKLNAVMELNPDALAIAQERDAKPTTGRLHGIPILLKGNIGTGDKQHTTAGTYALKDSILAEDAYIVKKLRAEGAIILGKVNLSELAYYVSSEMPSGYSTLGGQTHNPYGKFDAGGSSTGSAVAAVAGFAQATIGTETAGSIVCPSSQNSVVGIKPTLGLVSRNRIIPITEAMDTAGPMTRNVADAALILHVIAGTDAADPETAQSDAKKVDYTADLSAADLNGVKLLVLNMDIPRTGEQEILERVEQELSALGAEVVRSTFGLQPMLAFSPSDILSVGFQFDLPKYLTMAGVEGVSEVKDIIRINQEDLAGRAPHGQDVLERSAAQHITYEQFVRMAQDNREQAAAAIGQLLAESGADAIVSLSNDKTLLYAPAGCPAINVPAGYKDTGEPIGVTFFANSYTEHKLIQIAAVYEKKTKHHKPPVLS